jgi:hypothetical protein
VVQQTNGVPDLTCRCVGRNSTGGGVGMSKVLYLCSCESSLCRKRVSCTSAVPGVIVRSSCVCRQCHPNLDCRLAVSDIVRCCTRPPCPCPCPSTASAALLDVRWCASRPCDSTRLHSRRQPGSVPNTSSAAPGNTLPSRPTACPSPIGRPEQTRPASAWRRPEHELSERPCEHWNTPAKSSSIARRLAKQRPRTAASAYPPALFERCECWHSGSGREGRHGLR